MPNKLSYSQLNKFKFCPQAWKWHYIDRVRPIAIPSPLIFGAAVGKAFEHILVTEYQNPAPFYIAEDIFNKNWKEQEINGVLVDLSTSDKIEYLKSDHDPELADTPYESLRVKGHLMIRAFREELLPLITKVYSTEEKVELFSGEDSNIGYADAVIGLQGYDSPIVIDFKTAGRKYEQNSVKESVQLSQYLYTLGDKYKTNLAGYAVFLKNINKNRKKICKICGFDGSGTKFKTCNNEIMFGINFMGPVKEPKLERCNSEWIETIHPSCSVQIIIDEIDLKFQEQTIDEIGIINDRINTGVIERNLDGCENDGFYRRCSYYNLCHSNSLEGLVVLEERKKID